jgi:phosphoribosylformylglycinamidine (FGAM) synthase-like enzyme
MGARPIGILDFLRFGTDDHSKHLLKEAMRGISYYGNCIGVPNIGGDCKVHDSYNTNPLVNVCSLGIVKKENIIYGRATQIDQYLVYVGSKTGNEGINGAAMASNTFVDSNVTDELKSNVQKCDPFLEKLLLEACCEISELKLVTGMQDMGAGGLLCASVEVIKRGREKNPHMNLGCKIDLSEVPLKHQMQPENILISESQERMLIVCDGRNLKQISEIFKKWDLEYAVVGHTNNSGKYSVVYEDEEVYSASIDSFQDVHDYSNLPSEVTKKQSIPQKYKDINLEIYDSTVGNRTIKGPDQKGQWSILDIPEVNGQLVLTWGESVWEANQTLKKFQGVKPLCAVNCLNFGDPKYSLEDFKTCIQAMRIQCINNDIPIIGGNVSLYNTTGDQSIYPSPIIVLMGLL